MGHKRKYEKAWDIVDKTWKTPEDIAYNIMRDRPRFISKMPDNMGDGGEILSFVKGTSKRRGHFKRLKKYSQNNYENRKKITEQEIHKESSVHKMCKTIFELGLVKTIHTKEIQIPIVVGTEQSYLKVHEQDVEVIELESVEKKDKTTNRIPDIIVHAKICGFEQRFFIEIFYKHPVDQYKKQDYIQNEINCLEIDVGDVYEELKEDHTEEELKQYLIDKIQNNAEWISCNIEEIIKCAIDNNFNVISTTNGSLRKSKYSNDLCDRAYVFESDLTLHGKCEVHGKSHDIGKCARCSRCLGIKGYRDNDINNIEVYCSIWEYPLNATIEQKEQDMHNRIRKFLCRYAEKIKR